MKSRATQKFWKLYLRLPQSVQRQAQKIYQLWTDNPHHPSLHFKRVDDKSPIFSVRVNDNYRVLGLLQDDTLVWYWVGNHQEYELLLKQKDKVRLEYRASYALPHQNVHTVPA